MSVDQNTKSPTADHVHSVTSDIQTVGHANVTSMEPMATTVNHQTANARANQILLAISVNDVLMDSLDMIVSHVNAI